MNKTHKVHAPKFQGVFFLGVLKRRRQRNTHAPCWETPKPTKIYSKFRNIRKYTQNLMKILLIPGYPATAEFLRSRIAIIARIPRYIYPDISLDTMHQPDMLKIHHGASAVIV